METVIRTWRDRLSVLEGISWTWTVAVEMRQKSQTWTFFRVGRLDIGGGCVMRIMKLRSGLTAELEGNCRTMPQTQITTIKGDPNVNMDRSKGPK